MIYYICANYYTMGKGDKKSKRGKIHIGSYGKKRKRKTTKSVVIAEVKTEKKSVKSKKTEIAADVVISETPKPKKSAAKPKKEEAAQPDLFDNQGDQQ